MTNGLELYVSGGDLFVCLVLVVLVFLAILGMVRLLRYLWGGGPPRMPPAATVVLLIAACLGATVAHAAETPSPTPTPAFRYGLQSWAMTLVKPGEDRHFLAGARGTASYHVTERLAFDARVDASAISDGGAVNVELTNPASFSTLEMYVNARFQIVPGIYATALYGYIIPTDGGKLAILTRYPQAFGAGAIIGDSTGRWALLAIGKDDAAGAGLRLLVSGEMPLDGRISAVADGAIGGGGSFIRAGVAVRLQ